MIENKSSEKFNLNYFLNNFKVYNQSQYTEHIKYGEYLDFAYINFQNLSQDELNNCGVNIVDIFKFNLNIITMQMSVYFPNISIKIQFDVPNRNESIIMDYEYALKHDVYIEFKYSNIFFDCGFDFLKKTKNIDEQKYISSLVNLDYYKYFDEELDKVNIFIDECIYRLLIIICCICNDEYKLAEIIFINSNKHNNNLKQQIQIFNKVIDAKKKNYINLYDFYEQIIPINLNTGNDMLFDEFLQYLNDNIFIHNDINLINYNICWEDFETLITEINSDISFQIKNYKKIFTQSIGTLIKSLKTINELTIQINKTKRYIPQYINNFISNLEHYSNKDLLLNVKENLDNFLLNSDYKKKK